MSTLEAVAGRCVKARSCASSHAARRSPLPQTSERHSTNNKPQLYSKCTTFHNWRESVAHSAGAGAHVSSKLGARALPGRAATAIEISGRQLKQTKTPLWRIALAVGVGVRIFQVSPGGVVDHSPLLRPSGARRLCSHASADKHSVQYACSLLMRRQHEGLRFTRESSLPPSLVYRSADVSMHYPTTTAREESRNDVSVTWPCALRLASAQTGPRCVQVAWPRARGSRMRHRHACWPSKVCLTRHTFPWPRVQSS